MLTEIRGRATLEECWEQRDVPLSLSHDVLTRFYFRLAGHGGEVVDLEVLKAVAMTGYLVGKAEKLFKQNGFIDEVVESEQPYATKAALVWGYEQGQRGVEGLRFS